MMKFNKLIVTLLLNLMAITSTVNAAANPTCILMKFTDDTRFVKIESAISLSDLVMEKLLNSGKFNFKETKPIDEDIEKLLYEERAAEFKNAQTAIDSGDYTPLFEGPGFNENKAQTIATAQVGQIVSPDIILSIGKQHDADYLIQGTIRNLGTGAWWDTSLQSAISVARGVVTSALGSALGPAGALLGGFETTVTGIGVQADLKLIKVSTGEVVWQKIVTGKKTQKQQKIGLGGIASVKIGSTKLNNEMYTEAMDITAGEIANEIIADLDAGKLFLK